MGGKEEIVKILFLYCTPQMEFNKFFRAQPDRYRRSEPLDLIVQVQRRRPVPIKSYTV